MIGCPLLMMNARLTARRIRPMRESDANTILYPLRWRAGASRVDRVMVVSSDSCELICAARENCSGNKGAVICPISLNPPKFLFTNVKVINFDGVPDGTVISKHYLSKFGVTFSSITTKPAKRWDAFARQTPTAELPHNVVSVEQSTAAFFDASNGGIEASFEQEKPQKYVSIDVFPVVTSELFIAATNRPFLQSFDRHGHVLDTTFLSVPYGDPNYFSWHTLSFEAPTAEIARAVFSSEFNGTPHVMGLFDQFMFCHEHPRFPLIPLGLGPH